MMEGVDFGCDGMASCGGNYTGIVEVLMEVKLEVWEKAMVDVEVRERP